MSRFLLCTVLLLLAPLGLLSTAADPPQLNALTPAVRQRIDKAADQLAPERAAQKQLDWAGNLSGWMLSRIATSAEEEKEAAAVMRQRVLKDHKEKVKPTPPAATKVLERLLKELPAALKPDCYTYSLTVLDSKEPLIFTIGAGHLYITTALLDPLLAAEDRGTPALAFFLAHELGHIARLHTRRGYQLQKVLDEVEKGIKVEIDAELLKEVLETSLAPTNKLVPFLYTRRQHHEADLFALHLCRNAKLDLDAVLDGLRWLIVTQHPDFVTKEDYHPSTVDPPRLWQYYLSSHPDSLRRLQRVRQDWLGLVEDKEQHGLFRWDATTGAYARCKDGAFKGSEKPIVFVHGLRGGPHSFEEFLRYFAKQKELQERPLLAFFYPNNGSLSRAGQLLAHEMTRVIADAKQTTFITHSAGGLAFRFYAEKTGGGFEQAFLLGVPNEGSNLTNIKFLVDVGQFVRLLRRGLPDAIANTLQQGEGQIIYDLQPESLFLNYLGHDARSAGRYNLYYGKALRAPAARALALGMEAARLLLQDHLEGHSALVKGVLQRVVDQLQLPDEIAEGDLIVKVSSARLEGAKSETETRLNHQTLKTNEDVIKSVLQRVR